MVALQNAILVTTYVSYTVSSGTVQLHQGIVLSFKTNYIKTHNRLTEILSAPIDCHVIKIWGLH